MSEMADQQNLLALGHLVTPAVCKKNIFHLFHLTQAVEKSQLKPVIPMW